MGGSVAFEPGGFNTCISASVDASGRLIASGIDREPGAWNKDGTMAAVITPAISDTLYRRVGDVFGWVILAMGSLAVIASFVGSLASAENSKEH
jgi:apolipoprotein N-acyltransferase